MNEQLLERFVKATEAIAASLAKMAQAEHRMMDLASQQAEQMRRMAAMQNGFGDPEEN